MTHAAIRSRRYGVAALLLALTGLAACHDDLVSPTNHPTPSGPMADLGTYIVHVDAVHRTVYVEAKEPDARTPAGVNARFYGKAGDIEHQLTFVAPTPINATDAMYHLQERIGNTLAFAIGTNSPHVAPAYPADTMGVYIYLSIPPYNLQCPTTCTVKMDSADGEYPFFESHGLPQPYLYFKTILEPGVFGERHRNFSDQSGIGGVDYFRTFNFHTTGSVTNFDFGIAVSAPVLNETRFKVFYLADSLPYRATAGLDHLRSEPDWRVFQSFTSGFAAISPPKTRNLVISSTPVQFTEKDTLEFYRSDSLHDSQDAYIDASMTASSLTTGTLPAVFLGLQDQTKAIILGISGTLTGFADCNGAFVGTPVPTVAARSTWRVAKYGTDSADIYSPDNSTTPLVRIDRGLLPTTCAKAPGGYDRFFFFGNITQPLGPTAVSTWQSVNYEIGANQP
jgi:hypothetical protein